MPSTTIDGLVDAALANGRASASNNRWRAFSVALIAMRELTVWHHDTMMLRATVGLDGRVAHGLLSDYHLDVGHGSVSDQRGMNLILARVGLPLRYVRSRGEALYMLGSPSGRRADDAPVPEGPRRRRLIEAGAGRRDHRSARCRGELAESPDA